MKQIGWHFLGWLENIVKMDQSYHYVLPTALCKNLKWEWN